MSNWIYEYSEMGIKEGLGTYIASDYSPPYLYILLLISRVKNYPWQYLVKAASILADLLLGYAVMKLASPEDSRNRLKADDPQLDDDSADSRL